VTIEDSREDREDFRDELRDEARKLAREARAIRRSLDEVGTLSSTRRRRTAYVLALGIVLATQLGDLHLDRCGPGTALDVAYREETAQRLRDLGEPAEFLCNAFTPFHTHDGEPWPQPGSAAGLVLYFTAGLGGLAWARRAPRTDEDTFDNEE
jgi:hypothetical protein